MTVREMKELARVRGKAVGSAEKDVISVTEQSILKQLEGIDKQLSCIVDLEDRNEIKISGLRERRYTIVEKAKVKGIYKEKVDLSYCIPERDKEVIERLFGK